MNQWMIPTLSEILAQAQPKAITDTNTKAERSWCGAIAALNRLLEQAPNSPGLILSTSPILTHLHLPIASWLFTAPKNPHFPRFQLPPAPCQSAIACPIPSSATPGTTPLLPNDPLIAEQFALVLTPKFSLLTVLAIQMNGDIGFRFAFDPQLITLAWEALRSRVDLAGNPSDLDHLDRLYSQLPPIAPAYQTVAEFSQLMMQHLPEPAISGAAHPKDFKTPRPSPSRPDLELLQAIAHEVKTPLSTIRTYTRLLLKRSNLPAEVIKRLQTIDRECTEQIDRFNLIFRAVELETASNKSAPTHLTTTSLIQVVQESIPRWQKQASRRNITLDAILPQHMPMVVSDPNLLDQVLTNVINNFTSTLPTGSHVQVEVTPAGDQLKLQLISESQKPQPSSSLSPFKALGQLLMFQPETGNLSLNLSVTKNLFEAIGGKLLIRQRPQQGAIMTIFLPMRLSEYHQFN